MIEDDCIIRQDKIESLQKIGVHIWEKGLADTAMGLPYSRRKMTMVF